MESFNQFLLDGVDPIRSSRVAFLAVEQILGDEDDGGFNDSDANVGTVSSGGKFEAMMKTRMMNHSGDLEKLFQTQIDHEHENPSSGSFSESRSDGPSKPSSRRCSVSPARPSSTQSHMNSPKKPSSTKSLEGLPRNGNETTDRKRERRSSSIPRHVTESISSREEELNRKDHSLQVAPHGRKDHELSRSDHNNKPPRIRRDDLYLMRPRSKIRTPMVGPQALSLAKSVAKRQHSSRSLMNEDNSGSRVAPSAQRRSSSRVRSPRLQRRSQSSNGLEPQVKISSTTSRRSRSSSTSGCRVPSQTRRKSTSNYSIVGGEVFSAKNRSPSILDRDNDQQHSQDANDPSLNNFEHLVHNLRRETKRKSLNKYRVAQRNLLVGGGL